MSCMLQYKLLHLGQLTRHFRKTMSRKTKGFTSKQSHLLSGTQFLFAVCHFKDSIHKHSIPVGIVLSLLSSNRGWLFVCYKYREIPHMCYFYFALFWWIDGQSLYYSSDKLDRPMGLGLLQKEFVFHKKLTVNEPSLFSLTGPFPWKPLQWHMSMLTHDDGTQGGRDGAAGVHYNSKCHDPKDYGAEMWAIYTENIWEEGESDHSPSYASFYNNNLFSFTEDLCVWRLSFSLLYFYHIFDWEIRWYWKFCLCFFIHIHLVVFLPLPSS